MDKSDPGPASCCYSSDATVVSVCSNAVGEPAPPPPTRAFALAQVYPDPHLAATHLTWVPDEVDTDGGPPGPE